MRRDDNTVKDVTSVKINALPRNKLSISLGAQPPAPLFFSNTYWNGARVELVWTSETYGVFRGYSSYSVEVVNANNQVVATLSPPGGPNQPALDSFSASTAEPRLVLDEINPASMPIFADDPIKISWRNERRCGLSTSFSFEFWDPAAPATRCAITQSLLQSSPYYRELFWGDRAVGCSVLDSLPVCTKDKALSLRVTTSIQGVTYSSNTITVRLTRIKKKAVPPIIFRGVANTKPFSWSFWTFSLNGPGMFPMLMGPSVGTTRQFSGCSAGATCSLSFRVNANFPREGAVQVNKWAGLAHDVRVCLDWITRWPDDNPFVAQTPFSAPFAGTVFGNCWPVETPFTPARRHALESPDLNFDRLLPPSRARGLKQTSGDLWIQAPTLTPFVGEPVTFTAQFDPAKLSGYTFFWARLAFPVQRLLVAAAVILQASKANAQDPTIMDEVYAFISVESRNRPATVTTTATNLLPASYRETPVRPPALSDESPEVLATAKVLVGLPTGVTVTGPDLVEACSDAPASFRFGSVANASIAYPTTLRVTFGDNSPAVTRTVSTAQAWPVLQKSYSNTGTYEVKVSATNSAGESSAVFYVAAFAGPPRGLSANISSSVVRTGENVTVTASRAAGCGPVQYWVDWGELASPETFLLEDAGVHSYSAFGRMNLTVKAHSPEGNSSLVVPIEVLPTLPSELSITTEGTPVAGRPIKALVFAGKGDDPMNFLWTALSEGDGFGITETYTNFTDREVWGQEVRFTPASPGDRVVRIQAFNPAGNVSATFVIAVNGAPPSPPKIRIVSGNSNSTAPAEGAPLAFSAEVESGNGPFTFDWTLAPVALAGERWLCKRSASDSTVTKSTGGNPVVTHTFTDGGPKRVTVTVSSRWGQAQGSLDLDVAGAEPTDIAIAVQPSSVIVGENTTISVAWAGTGPFSAVLNFPDTNFTLRSSSVQRVSDCRFQTDFIYFFASRGLTPFYAAVMNSWRVAVANATVDALWAQPASSRRGLLDDTDPCPNRDRCGTCGGSNQCVDCAGVINGGLRKDLCGVCGGDGSTCKGCDGLIEGQTYDACNVCGGDNTECRPILDATTPLFPTSGNRRSPVILTIRGTNFLATEDLTCLFDGIRVPATLLRSPDRINSVLCAAPLSARTGTVPVSVEFTRAASKVALGVRAVHTFRTAPVTYTYRDGAGSLAEIVPASAPAFGAGSTSITVFGSGLLQADGNAFVQVGDLRFKPSNFSQDGCSFAFSLPPKGATDPFEQTLTYLPDGSEAAQNTLRLTYFNHPVLPTLLSPSRGWLVVASPSAIRLVGQNLGGLPKEARCRWSVPGGAEAEVQAILSSGGVSCPAPVPVRQSTWGARGAAGLPKLSANCSKPVLGPCTCQPTAAPSNTPAEFFEMPLPDSAFGGAPFTLQVALAPNGVSYVDDSKLDFTLYPSIEVVSVSPTRIPAAGGSQLTLRLAASSFALLQPLLVEAAVFVGGVECSGLALDTSPSSVSCVTGAVDITGTAPAPITFRMSPGSGRSPATGAATSVTVFGNPVVSWGAVPTPVLASIYGGISITVRATTDGFAAFSFADFGTPRCAVATAFSTSAPLEIVASWSAVSAADGNVNCGTLPDLQRVVLGASLPADYFVVVSITNGVSWTRQSTAALTIYDAVSPDAVAPAVVIFDRTNSVLVTGRLLYVQGRTRCFFGSAPVDALPASTNDAIVCPTKHLSLGVHSLAISLGSPRDLEKAVSITVIGTENIPTCISVPITGTSFTNTGSALRCRTQWGADGGAVMETSAAFVSASSVRCTLPNLGDSWAGDIALSLAFDGVSFVDAGSVTVWDDSRPPSLESVLPSSASSGASASTTVTVCGSNFAPNAGQLTCRWTDLADVATSTAATFRSSFSAICAVPPYSNSTHKSSQLRVSNSPSGETSAGFATFNFVLANAQRSSANVPSAMLAGSTSTFTMTARDSNGVLSNDPDISFKVVVTPVSTHRPVDARTFVTDKGAQATLSFTEIVAGSYSVQVLLGNEAVQTETLVVNPAALSIGMSSAAISLRSFVAGNFAGDVSAVIRDVYGNTIQDQAVIVSIRSVSNDTLVWSWTSSTRADGTVSTELSAAASSVTAAGSYILSVAVDGQDLSGGLQGFTVVPGAPSAEKTQAAFSGCSPLIAGESCNLDVLVRDAHDNLIASAGSSSLEILMELFETVRDPAAAVPESSPSVTLDGCTFPKYTAPSSSSEVKRDTVTLSRATDGVAFTTTLSLTKATTYRAVVSLKLNDTDVLPLSLPPTPHIVVVAGDQTSDGFLLEERGRNASFSPSFQAGAGLACLTFAALDRYRNARVGVESIFPWALELAASPSTSLAQTSIVSGNVSLGAGRYGIVVGSTLAGSFRLTLGSDFAPLAMTVTPSAADANQTVLTPAVTTAPTAGSEIVLRISVRDAYKNRIDLSTWGPVSSHFEVSVAAVGETRPAASAHPPSVQLDYSPARDGVLARLLVVPTGSFRVSVSMRSSVASAFEQSVSSVISFQPAAVPAISRAVFAPSGDSIDVQFDVSTNMADMVEPNNGHVASEDCARVLSAATNMLLEGASCSWPSPSLLVVSLGPQSTIMPGDSIAVKANVLFTAVRNSLPSTATSTLLQPLRPLLPSATAVAPPVIGACSELVLQAVSVSGGGNRDVTLSWSARVLNAPAASAAAAATALEAAIAAQQGRPIVNLTSAVAGLPSNAEFEFSLTPRNFFGNRGPVSSVRVSKTSDLTVSTSIHGSSTISLRRTAALELSGEVALASCEPVADLLSRLQLAWSVVDPPGVNLATVTNVTSRQLRLDLAQIDTRQMPSLLLQFRADLQVDDALALASTSAVLVRFVPSPITVRLDKSGTVLVPTNIAGGLELTATATDPDSGSTSDWAYSWTCADASRALCAGSNFLGAASGQTLSIPASFFQTAGATYAFSVTVRSAAKRAVFEAGSYATAGVSVAVFPADSVPAASKSAASIPPSLLAGDTAAFEVTVRDEQGDAPAQAGVEITIIVSPVSTQRPRQVRQFTVSVGQNGVGSMSFSESSAGEYSVGVLLANEAVGNSPYTLFVQPAAVDLPSSAVTFTWGSLKPGASIGLAQATIRDRFGNAIPEQSVTFTISGPDASAPWTYSANSTVAGTVSVDVPATFTAAGAYVASATVAGEHISGSPKAFSIAPSAPDPSTSALSVDWTPSLVAGATGGVATVAVRDQFGNSVDGSSVVFKIFKVGGSGNVQIWTQTSLTSSGLASANLSSLNTAGSYILTATIGNFDVDNSPMTFSVVPAAADPSKTTLTLAECTSMTAGDACIAQAVVRDEFENVIAPADAGPALVLRLYKSGVLSATANSTASLTLETCSFPTYDVTAAASESLEKTVPLSAAADGASFTASFTLTVAAAYRVELDINSALVPSAVLPSTTPHISIRAAHQSLGDTLLEERAANPQFHPSVQAGAGRACLTLVARDGHGNLRFAENNHFPLTLNSTATLLSGPVSLGAGHYGFAVGSELAGEFALALAEGFTPLDITIVPSVAASAKSNVSFEGCSDQIAGSSQLCTATATVRDAYGNLVQDGTTVVFIVKRGDAQSLTNEVATTSGSATYSLPTADLIAGDYTLSVQPVAQPVADGDAEPEPVAQPVAQPVADGDAEPEPVAQPVADGDAEPEPVAQPIADRDAEPEPVAQPVADGDAEPEPVAQPVADGDAEPEPVAQPVADGDAEPEPSPSPSPTETPSPSPSPSPSPTETPSPSPSPSPSPTETPSPSPSPSPSPTETPSPSPSPSPSPTETPSPSPDAEPEPVAQPVADGDAEPEPVAQPVADGDAEPEPVAQPVADGDAEPEPVAQPVADGDAEPEPVAQPVADGDAEPEPIAQPVADRDAEPEPVAQPIADRDAEPEPVSQPIADRDAEPEPVSQPIADRDAEPEPVAQPVADGDAEPEPVAQPVADGDAEPEPVAQPVADGDAEPEPVAQPVADGDAEPEPVAQPIADRDAEPEPVAQPIADRDAEPEPVAQPVADGDAEPEPVAQPVADGDAEPEPVAQPVADEDAEPEPVAQPIADRDAEPEPVAQPVADGDAEPEPLSKLAARLLAFAGEGMVLAKFVDFNPGATTVQLFGLHSGLRVVSYSITNAEGTVVTKTPSSSAPNVLIETVGSLAGILLSDRSIRPGVAVSLTFRTTNGNTTRDTTISGALTSVPGAFASYAVLSGSSDAGCLPPSLATLLWTAASLDPLSSSARATITVSNASVVASSVISYNVSKGASGAPTVVRSGAVISPAAFFDSVSTAHLAVETAFYARALAGAFVQPEAAEFPTAAPAALACAAEPASVAVVLPITLAECQDGPTQAGLAAAAASTAGVDPSSVAVQCAAARRGRALRSSSTKVTYVFAASSSVPAGAAAQAFLQQISCGSCIEAFSNNLATGLADAGSSVSVEVTPEVLKLVAPSGALVDPTSPLPGGSGSGGPAVLSVDPPSRHVVYYPPDNFTVTPPTIEVTVANLDLTAADAARCSFRLVGSAATAAAMETAATVLSASRLRCPAPAHPRFLPELWNATYRVDVLAAGAALPPVDAPNTRTFTWSVSAPPRAVGTFAAAGARYGQATVRVLLAARPADFDATPSRLASLIVGLPLPAPVGSHPALTASLLASMFSAPSVAAGATPAETVLLLAFQQAAGPEAGLLPARALAWALASALARPWARLGGAEVLQVSLAAPAPFPIALRLVSFVDTEDLAGETPEARLTRSLVNAREAVLFPGAALPEPGQPSVAVVGSAMADDVRVEVYDTLQTTAHAFAQALRDYALCDGNVVDLAFVVISASTLDTAARAPALRECAAAGTNPLLRLRGMPYGHTFVHVALSTDFRRAYGNKNAEEKRGMRLQALAEAADRAAATARPGVPKSTAEASIRDSEFAPGSAGAVVMLTLGPVPPALSRMPASYVAGQLLQTRSATPRFLGFPISGITISDAVPLDVVLTFGGAPPAASALEAALRAALRAQFAEFGVSRPTVFLRHLATAGGDVTLRLLDYDALSATAMAQHLLDLCVCRGTPVEGAIATGLAPAPSVLAPPELAPCVTAAAAVPAASVAVFNRQPGASVAAPALLVLGQGFPAGEPGVACRFEPLGSTPAARAASALQTPATVLNDTAALCAAPPAPAFVASLWPVAYRVGLKVPSRPLDAYARSPATFAWELSVPPLAVASVPPEGLAYGQAAVLVALAGAPLAAAELEASALASEVLAVSSEGGSPFASLSHAALAAMLSGAAPNGTLVLTFQHELSPAASVVPAHTFARALAAALSAPWSALHGRPVTALAVSQPLERRPDGRVALYDGVAATGMAFAAALQQHAVCAGNALAGGVVVLGVSGAPDFPRCAAPGPAAGVAGLPGGSALARIVLDADFAAFVGGLSPEGSRPSASAPPPPPPPSSRRAGASTPPPSAPLSWTSPSPRAASSPPSRSARRRRRRGRRAARGRPRTGPRGRRPQPRRRRRRALVHGAPVKAASAVSAESASPFVDAKAAVGAGAGPAAGAGAAPPPRPSLSSSGAGRPTSTSTSSTPVFAIAVAAACAAVGLLAVGAAVTHVEVLAADAEPGPGLGLGHGPGHWLRAPSPAAPAQPRPAWTGTAGAGDSLAIGAAPHRSQRSKSVDVVELRPGAPGDPEAGPGVKARRPSSLVLG
eukprot:tig00020816_g14206.t1